MNATAKSILDVLPIVIHQYFKQMTKKEMTGVIDLAKTSADVINYMEDEGIIHSYEKTECFEYMTNVIGVACGNRLPEFVLQTVYSEMCKVSGYSPLAKMLYTQCKQIKNFI